MKMTFDAEAGAAYIQLVPKIETVDDSWPLDGPIAGINDVIVDLDGDRNVLGVEILCRDGEGPERILAAIADETIANALAAEGFEVPRLRGNPVVSVQQIG